MVYLKKLEIRNFKSFGSKRVTIELDKGLTVITGPNGSGKSNILDAIRFVLGDLSSRSLRADKMSEIIFDGVKGNRPLIASVRVTLDNCDRQLPVDVNIITISRKVNREGNSEYSLNGRQIPRGQLVDILRMAGLSSSGYNMIIQGTITRLADVTPKERIKVIEDLIGIAEYDAKKTEARTQLQQAEVNLRIASVRIGDVQARLEKLEEERNNALRYSFVQKEITKLQVTIASHKLLNLEEAKATYNKKLKQKLSSLELLKNQFKQITDERKKIETQRRQFDNEIVDKGNFKLISLQSKIGELMASISALKTEIDSGNDSLKSLQNIQEDRVQQFKTLKKRIREAQKKLKTQKNQRDKIKKQLDLKNSSFSSKSSKLIEIKNKYEKNIVELNENEKMLNDFKHQASNLDVKIRTHQLRKKILEDEVENLTERRNNFELTLKDLQEHFIELEHLLKNEKKSLTQISEIINRNISKEQTLSSELDRAENTFKKASGTIIEFDSQKSLAEKLGTEEYSLRKIEEMGRAGAIPGVFGQLEKLIEIPAQFQKAIKAASLGWLKSVIVKDFETALRCIESLKKMKLGQVKFVPIKEIRDIDVVKAPEIDGVIGLASSLIKYDEKYFPAICFIFGDTIVTSGEKSAFIASRNGYRAVDLNGDLYEAGGGIMGGYYREPINFQSMIPSSKAIEELTVSIRSLGDLLDKRKSEIRSIGNDVANLKEERTHRAEVIKSMENETKVIELNLTRARQNIFILNKRVEKLNSDFKKENDFQIQCSLEREKCNKTLSELEIKRKILRKQTQKKTFEKLEKRHNQLNLEINERDREFAKIENEIKFLESNLKNILIPEFEGNKIDNLNIEKQISSFKDRVTKAKQSLDEANKQISELEKSKEIISSSLLSVKDKRREFEEQFDRTDEIIKKINRESASLNTDINALELDIQKNSLEIRRIEAELLSSGYERIREFTTDEVEKSEASKRFMELELEHLGSINQLAITQYREQKENYKEMSIRQNELEKERRTILDFMEEIERRKKEAFMQSFRDLNKQFSQFFTRLTESGEGYLELQNLDDPLMGGVDIFVKFPGKESRLISGASGGEKSVTAVAFILAIQNLFPTPFYMFDEIDAHLDPQNAERLADLLKERAVDSQMIALTLRDVIMDRADRLFGTYIQNGVSHVISTKISEITA